MDEFIISLAYRYNGWGLALYTLVVTLIAAFLAGVIGIEREMKGQAAGLRTHVLLSVGCTLLMVISIFGIGLASGQINLSDGSINGNLSYDTSRIAAGIIAGIGFVCAGTIIRTGLSVRGLTTAATLWVSAGIGMACGSGMILEAIAVALVTMVLLIGLLYIEKALGKSSPQVRLTVEKSVTLVRDLRQQADANALIVKNIVTYARKDDKGNDTLVINVLFALQSSQAALEEFCESFANREGVISLEKIHFKNPVGE
jgi:putative Mg2+ transporter-C (MgtC) family protein